MCSMEDAHSTPFVCFWKMGVQQQAWLGNRKMVFFFLLPPESSSSLSLRFAYGTRQ